MTLAYAVALAEARSCLAALADAASDIYESSHCERLLVDLDGLHPVGPALSTIIGSNAELLDRPEAAIDRLIDLGGAGLSLELLRDAALFGRNVCRVEPGRHSMPVTVGLSSITLSTTTVPFDPAPVSGSNSTT